MYSKQPKQRQLFLEQFEGKKNTIGKEGLLHLLEVQRQSRDKQPPSSLRTPMAKLKPLQQQIQQNPPKTEPHGQKYTKQMLDRGGKALQLNQYPPNKRYAGMPNDLPDFKSQQIRNRDKLPSINKSSSMSTQSRKQHTAVLNGQVTNSTNTSGKHKLKSLVRRPQNESVILNNLSKKMQLDTYALRHLQFMQRFQKQLIDNDIGSKREARSRYSDHN